MAVREEVKPEAGKVVDMSWDPITRIVGNLGIYTKIDFDNREVLTCKSTSSLFRGYSVFMKGKDPRDAHFITSRICGICGDNHAVCSCYAQQMAYGVKPPPLAEWIVNLGEAAEYIFDHIIFQDNLVFVDFCEQMVRETTPSVWAKAEKAEAPGANVHGYKTVGDIMRSYNPFTGETYREALHMSRVGREMICLMEGRHVHPSTSYPGGVGTVATPTLLTDYLTRLLGRLQQARPRRLRLPQHGRVGQRDVRDPGRRGRRRARHHQPRRHQPRDPHPARLLLLRGLDRRADVRPQRPPGQPRRQAPPLEPDDDPQAPEARSRGRQLQLGDEPALVRQAHRGQPRARHGRRGAGAPVGDGAGQQGRHVVR